MDGQSRDIVLSPEQMDRLKIIKSPMRGEKREDKKVVYVSESGVDRGMTSIMLGNNKKGIRLADGTFASTEDIASSLQTYITSMEKGEVVVSRKTGRTVDPQELSAILTQIVEASKKASGSINISEGGMINHTEYVNMDARGASQGPSQNTKALTGSRIQIPGGDYVNIEDINQALQDYMVVKKEEQEKTTDDITPVIPDVVDPIKKEEPEKEDKTRKEDKKPILSRLSAKERIRVAPLAALAVAAAVSTTKIPINIEPIYQYEELHTIDTEVTSTDKVDFTLKTGERIIMDGESSFVNPYQGMEIGIGSGIDLTEQEDLFTVRAGGETGKTLEYFQEHENKGPGEYSITGYAVEVNGEVYYIENYDNSHVMYSNVEGASPDLATFIDQVTEGKEGLTNDDVHVYLHFGHSSDFTRLGWIDSGKLIETGEIDIIADDSVVTYSGETESEYATIMTDEGEVRVKLTDESGNFAKPGDVVIGADGKEYTVTDIQEKIEFQVTETEHVEQVLTEKDNTPEQLKDYWTKRFVLAAGTGLTAAAAAAAALELKKKKKDKSEKSEDSPENTESKQNTDEQDVRIRSFESEDSYKKFKEKFRKSKAKMEKKSLFHNLFYKKQEFLQRLTEEQVDQIYTMFRDAYPDKKSTIEFVDETAIVRMPDGKKYDLKELDPTLYEQMMQVGKGNEYEARTR